MNLFQSTSRALSISLDGLKEALQAGGGTVEHITIAPGLGADGRRLAELALPDSVGIVLVRRGDSMLFPHAEVVLRAGDQVTLIGRRSAMPAALQSLRA